MGTIKVDDLRGIKPGYTIGSRLAVPGNTITFGPFEGILRMDDDTITFRIGYYQTFTLPREAEVYILDPRRLIDTDDAVHIWEDNVGDSGKAPTDEELRDFAIAVLNSVGIR